ncbi:hypothetical protein [Thermoplasma sp. Kam2015]|uniref:hypothetical protein n=1 Tax=Thermoplasma sp. Kam2015 TaxID=2094122 RepID=UPI001292CDEC|nr:hypothetical protein [Thermoplasma sp. Kam2015]
MESLVLSLVPKEVEEELRRLYPDPSPIIEIWNSTQVRPPFDAGEMEDLFYGL